MKKKYKRNNHHSYLKKRMAWGQESGREVEKRHGGTESRNFFFSFCLFVFFLFILFKTALHSYVCIDSWLGSVRKRSWLKIKHYLRSLFNWLLVEFRHGYVVKIIKTLFDFKLQTSRQWFRVQHRNDIFEEKKEDKMKEWKKKYYLEIF